MHSHANIFTTISNLSCNIVRHSDFMFVLVGQSPWRVRKFAVNILLPLVLQRYCTFNITTLPSLLVWHLGCALSTQRTACFESRKEASDSALNPTQRLSSSSQNSLSQMSHSNLELIQTRMHCCQHYLELEICSQCELRSTLPWWCFSIGVTWVSMRSHSARLGTSWQEVKHS